MGVYLEHHLGVCGIKKQLKFAANFSKSFVSSGHQGLFLYY
jgi:hypothetical protein